MATPGGSVSQSGTNYIDGLLWGVKYNDAYSSPITYYMRGDYGSWSATEEQAFEGALQSWANVANIRFTQVQSDTSELWAYKVSGSQMTQLTGSSSVLAFFTPPDNASFPADWGVGAFNYDMPGWHTQGLQQGGFAYSVMIHELG
nr:hypothetical protein [Alphaproteobacteria bacterium]